MSEIVTIESLIKTINENKDMGQYINNNIEYDNINKLIEKLANDLYYIYNNIIDDFDVIMKYEIKLKELSISIRFIQSSNILDESLFSMAISYYEKYENYLIDEEVYDIGIDFDVTTKNENLKIITIYDSGK